MTLSNDLYLSVTIPSGKRHCFPRRDRTHYASPMISIRAANYESYFLTTKFPVVYYKMPGQTSGLPKVIWSHLTPVLKNWHHPHLPLCKEHFEARLSYIMDRFQDFRRILGHLGGEQKNWPLQPPDMDARQLGKGWIDNLLEARIELSCSTHARQ